MPNVSSYARRCAVDDCPDQRADFAPLCLAHVVECWRYVEANPAIRPHRQIIDKDAMTRHGDVKIGFTSRLSERMRELRLDWPDCVLAVEPGGVALESRRHAQFRDERRGEGIRATEDFAPTARLMAHVESVRSEHGDPLRLGKDAQRRNAAAFREHVAQP